MTRPDANRGKVGRWFARKGWIHLVLLTGLGLFMFPFVWIVAMSLKTDDEVVTGDIFPSIPVFHPASPSVRPPPAKPEPPDGIKPGRWADLYKQLCDAGGKALANFPLPPGSETITDAQKSDLRKSAAAKLVDDVAIPMPEKTWALGDAAAVAEYANRLTPAALDSAVNDRFSRFELHGVELHNNGSDIVVVCKGEDICRKWTVESGNGHLLPCGPTASQLQYHFDSGSDAPVVLRYEFEMPFDPKEPKKWTADELHKVIVSYVGDDSWHHVDATLSVGNTNWKSGLTTYIAQYRAATFTFQPPGFDDTTFQAKTWVPLDPLPDTRGNRPVNPRNAELRLILRPSGTAGAIYGKVERNYLRAFRTIPFWTYVGNSVLLVVLQLFGALFSATFVAYAFARLQWPGRSLAFGLLLATMMVPSQVTLIPGFVIWRTLGWYNTLNPLWIASWFGSAFFIFLMTQFMKTIPKELEEAARIDGLNAVQTWWYIIVPLVKPTLAAIAIMVFMGAWNDFMGPLIMLRDQSRFPLSLGLFGMSVDSATDTTLVMAGNMLMTVPVIVIFFLFQRYFIEGVTVSGMKG
jgi:ABC-type glycerol-3-phosphate transport system permease component